MATILKHTYMARILHLCPFHNCSIFHHKLAQTPCRRLHCHGIHNLLCLFTHNYHVHCAQIGSLFVCPKTTESPARTRSMLYLHPTWNLRIFAILHHFVCYLFILGLVAVNIILNSYHHTISCDWSGTDAACSARSACSRQLACWHIYLNTAECFRHVPKVSMDMQSNVPTAKCWSLCDTSQPRTTDRCSLPCQWTGIPNHSHTATSASGPLPPLPNALRSPLTWIFIRSCP